MTVAIGVVYDRWAESADDLAAVLQENLGTPPVRARTYGLAGPNDVVQWIANAAEWKMLAIGLGGWLLGKVGDDVYSAIKDRLTSKLKGLDTQHAAKLAEGVNETTKRVQAAGGDIILSFHEPEIVDDQLVFRSIVAYLPPYIDDGGVTTARHIVAFASLVEKLDTVPNAELHEFFQTLEKPDGSTTWSLKLDPPVPPT